MPPKKKENSTSRGDSLEDPNTVILAAISDLKSSLSTQLQQLETRLDLLQVDLRGVREKVKDNSENIQTIGLRTDHLEKCREPLKKDLKDCLDRLEKGEIRSRKKNLRIVGLLEKAEFQGNGKSPEAFMEDLLRNILNLPEDSPQLLVEVDHRVPSRPPPVGAPPRTMLVRMSNVSVREAILTEARVKKRFP